MESLLHQLGFCTSGRMRCHNGRHSHSELLLNYRQRLGQYSSNDVPFVA